MKDWLLLMLRLVVGVGLAYWAGHEKVFDPVARQAYANLLHDAGIPAAVLLTILFGVVEFFGSLFLVAGFYFRQAAGLLLITLSASAAIQMLAFEQAYSLLFNWSDLQGLGSGYYLAGLLVLLFTGPGCMSFDAGRRRRDDE